MPFLPPWQRCRARPRRAPSAAFARVRRRANRRVRLVRDPLRAPETLHPSLWLGHQLGRTGSDAVATGFARLDAELPGGGWPRRALAELLLPHAGVGEIRLLAPALVAAQRAGRLVMFFDPPAALAAAALAGLGFDVEELLSSRPCRDEAPRSLRSLPPRGASGLGRPGARAATACGRSSRR